MRAKKLRSGDEVRVISPSVSAGIYDKKLIAAAKDRMERELGVVVSYGKNTFEHNEFLTSSIESRIEDFHGAFADENVKMVIPAVGGFNANDLLPYLDYDLIEANPKLFGGFSDITVLINAIYKKTGLETYHTTNFIGFGMVEGFEYTLDYFKKCFMEDGDYEVVESPEYSDDEWQKDQSERVFIDNKGSKTAIEGYAEGLAIGGNLCTLNLLQGTEYMPDLKDSILFLEEDKLVGCVDYYTIEFMRNLESLIQVIGFGGVKGVVFGRYQTKLPFDDRKMEIILTEKLSKFGIPVVYNADFGHTTPQFSFPIGGRAKLKAMDGKVQIGFTV